MDKEFFRSNKFVIIAAIIFILIKFAFIYGMWYDRQMPPEPDDSLSYINSEKKAHEAIYEKKTGDPLYYLQNLDKYWGWSFYAATLKQISGLDYTQTYHLNFYIGTILLLFALIYFLRGIENSPLFIGTGLLFLATYYGSGTSHGFFWVVTSFFSVLFFFILYGMITEEETTIWKYILLIIISAYFVTIHRLSFYAGIIFPIAFVFRTFFLREFDKRLFIKIVGVFIIITFVWAFTNNFFTTGKPSDLLPEEIIDEKSKTMFETPVITNERTISINETRVYQETSFIEEWLINKIFYLNPESAHLSFRSLIIEIGLNIFTLIALCFGIAILMLRKKYFLCSSLLSAFILTFLSLKVQYGYRFSIYLWPLIVITIAYGCYKLFKYLTEGDKETKYLLTRISPKWKKAIAIFLILRALQFAFLSLAKGVRYTYLVNNRMDVSWDNTCNEYLNTRFDPEKDILIQSNNVVYKLEKVNNIYNGRIHVEKKEPRLTDKHFFVCLEDCLRTDSFPEKHGYRYQEMFMRIKNKLELQKNCGSFNIFTLKDE